MLYLHYIVTSQVFMKIWMQWSIHVALSSALYKDRNSFKFGPYMRHSWPLNSEISLAWHRTSVYNGHLHAWTHDTHTFAKCLAVVRSLPDLTTLLLLYIIWYNLDGDTVSIYNTLIAIVLSGYNAAVFVCHCRFLPVVMACK